MNSPKILAALAAAIVLIWGGGALYLQSEISKTQKEYLAKKEITARYEALKAFWSESARKKALKQMETMLRMYGIKPKIENIRGKKSYTFSVTAARADKVLGKLLNSNIEIEHISAKKSSEDTLEVRVEVLQ